MGKIFNYIVEASIIGYMYFNRNPPRIIPSGQNLVSPADGTIIDINNNRIDMFLSIFDVHFQRSPSDGRITNIFEPTKQYSLIEIDSSLGHLTIERWAGELARTVSTFVKIGNYVKKGDSIGRILLGSHCSITIPPWLTIKVKIGDHVIAGETIIAE
jgi:phosphatidylserine decarboxylase